MTKTGFFYRDMSHLLNNKYVHIVVNNSLSPIKQVKYKNKGYTTFDIKRSDRARRLQRITVQLMQWILHEVNNKILQNLPILQEDVGMAEDIYRPSTLHLKGKTEQQNIQYLEPVKTKCS